MSLAQGYEIDESLCRIEFDVVTEWLAATYWSPGIERPQVERAAQHSSLVLGVYFDGDQVGYLRVISDRATFGYLCDVYVAESHRGKGLARAMVRYCLDHPEHQGMRRWLLATYDAHEVYRAVGFHGLEFAERWMMYRPIPRAPLAG